MDKAIRVLVANRPKLMREVILTTLSDQPGIEVVGEAEDDAEILNQITKALPDLLVISLDEPGKRPGLCDAALRERPELRILAVSSSQNYTMFYWASLNIHSNEIESSEEGILNAVRGLSEGLIGYRHAN